MTAFEHAISSYFSSTRHSTSIGEGTQRVHARRRALLRDGKVAQAAAVKTAGQTDGQHAQRQRK